MARNRTNRKAHQIPARVLDSDAAAAFALLKAEVAQQVETPDPGYRTTNQWAKAWDVDTKTARNYLVHGMGTGSVTTKDFRLAAGRQFRKIPHYKVLIERQK